MRCLRRGGDGDTKVEEGRRGVVALMCAGVGEVVYISMADRIIKANADPIARCSWLGRLNYTQAIVPFH